MKTDSSLFDRIRVKPDNDRRPKAGPVCQWAGCKEKATHRAPKGRENEREYWRFCLEHVRQYNQSYNFFAGMNDAAVMAYQKDAITGHRPTWKKGTGKASSSGRQRRRPLGRGPVGRGHPVVQLFEIGGFLLTRQPPWRATLL